MVFLLLFYVLMQKQPKIYYFQPKNCNFLVKNRDFWHFDGITIVFDGITIKTSILVSGGVKLQNFDSLVFDS